MKIHPSELSGEALVRPRPGTAAAEQSLDPSLPDSPENRRIETRLTFSLQLPLIGWRGEMKSIFKYRPLDVSAHGMRLIIEGDGHHAVTRSEDVDLCLPFLLDAELLNIGTVRWTDEVGADFLCGITLSHRPQGQYPVAFDFSSGEPVRSGSAHGQPDVVQKFIKRVLDDAVFIKRSMILYFNHLAPLVARQPAHRQPADLPAASERIARNIRTLQELSASISPDDSRETGHARLERFREAVLPEAAESALHVLDDAPELAPHLRSIRQAERKLALHYNTAVLLFEGFALTSEPGN